MSNVCVLLTTACSCAAGTQQEPATAINTATANTCACLSDHMLAHVHVLQHCFLEISAAGRVTLHLYFWLRLVWAAVMAVLAPMARVVMCSA